MEERQDADDVAEPRQLYLGEAQDLADARIVAPKPAAPTQDAESVSAFWWRVLVIEAGIIGFLLGRWM